ncbi:Gfo/Idh/MocA family protein [Oceanobacillus massiliensis]|uniref:Gfo/Idh/MocA family protein n=1 Tax=Oceanobacillus massiliensis TaxID=1465765 RepID=UPI000287E305|nr:Gfo/Idh/MocA family oxidoreductase [Oceanobacillus massiliensis]
MKVGVIGTGNMGENHVRTYLSLQDQCQLVGIYDNDSSKAEKIAEKYQVKQFPAIDDLLQSVDAVSIAVPTAFHYKIALSCIRHKVHMLIEKPITETIDQAMHLIQKAKEAEIKLQVGHIELFNPLIKFLAKELEKEQPIGISIHRMSPYDNRMKEIDVVNDLMIHDLYILKEILKENMAEFYALGEPIDQTTKHAAVIAKSSNGVIAQLTASFKSPKKVRTIMVLTEDRFIEADILKQEIKITRSAPEAKNSIPGSEMETIPFDHSVQPLTVQLQDFIDCIKHDTEPAVSGEDGVEALKSTIDIQEAIYNPHKNICTLH